MKSKSFVAFSVNEVKAKIEKEISEGLNPTLCILFSSIEINIDSLRECIAGFNIELVGSSSCGEIVCNQNSSEVVFEKSVVCLLIEIDMDAFRIVMLKEDGKDHFSLGQEMAYKGSKLFDNPSYILLGGGLALDGELVVNGVVQASKEGTPIFGGLAGDDANFHETFIFNKEEAINYGILGLILDGDKIEMKGIASSGWVGIGSEKTITKSENNVVYTIDNEHALDVYMSYLSVKESDLPQIGIEYPLLVKRKDGTFILRAVLDVNIENRSLTFAGSVPMGAKVKFSSSPGFNAMDNVKTELQSYFNNQDEADVMLLFSCMARHLALGPMVEDEIKKAYELWNKPLIGFFTYGEIGTSKTGVCDLHNQTYTLALLKWK